MKKLISLVLVVLLIFSLSVSAMASETDVLYNSISRPDIDAIWDKDTYPGAIMTETLLYFVSDIGHVDTIYNQVLYSGPSMAYSFSNGDWVFNPSWTMEAGNYSVKLSQYKVIWASETLYDSSGNVWLEYTAPVKPIEPFCDGSSCPANDIDHDGICDDCGMRLMNLVRTPTPPDVTGNNKNFVMFYTGETYYYTAYTSDSAYSIRGYNYGARMRSTSDIAVNVQRFESYDGLNWQSEYSGTAKDYYPGEQGWTLMSSTFNWYDSAENTTDPFFPVPLWAEVEKVTQGEMEATQAKTTETMVYLMVCGIGCLALLIVLSLFGKRSLIYRG